MRFCFILEEKYANEPMPMVVADQLHQWGHEIDVLQPYTAVTNLTDLSLTTYDAYVLKTVSEGPGLTLLEAAEAVGIRQCTTRYLPRGHQAHQWQFHARCSSCANTAGDGAAQG